MKKGYSLLFLAGALTLSASAQSKFDANGRFVMETYKAARQNQPLSIELLRSLPVSIDAVSARSDERVSVIVTLADGATAADLEARGLEILTDLGDMALASGTFDDIEALADCDFVKALSFGEKAEPMLDLAREATGVSVVHAGGDGLTKGYKGSGVIVGIYDTGIDPNHINFTDADGNTRVSRAWMYTGSDGRATEYTSENLSRFTASTTETHGTHTLGCATGSYNKRVGSTSGDAVAIIAANGGVSKSRMNVNPYYGMAPEAEILVGDGPLYDNNTIDALGRIRDYAKAQGKPAVVNLSIGTNVGPHDGSDATSQSLSRLGQDMIICISAGNEGDVPMSVSKNFSGSDTEFKTLTYGDTDGVQFIDIWSSNSTPFTLVPFVYDRSKKAFTYEYTFEGGQERTVGIVGGSYGSEYVPGGNKVTSDQVNAAYSGACFIMTSSKNTATNNRYQVRVRVGLKNNTNTNSARNLVFGFKVKGSAGQQIDVTTNSSSMQFASLGESGFTNGSADMSINSMAAAKNLIVVGAWNTRKSWPCMGTGSIGVMSSYYDNAGFEVGEYAGYSSYGKLADGRSLPHVSAPGSGIISSISTPYYNAQIKKSPNYASGVSAVMTVNGRVNVWENMQGTSMASPVVAGGIALWLQQDPNLKYDGVLEAIEISSTKDANVNAGPAVRWGAGKFNALQGLKYVIDPAGVNDIVSDGDADLIITPNGPAAWEIFAPYASAMKVDMYNLSGMHVASARGEGNTINFSADGLTKGIYLLNVNGTATRRVIVD